MIFGICDDIWLFKKILMLVIRKSLKFLQKVTEISKSWSLLLSNVMRYGIVDESCSNEERRNNLVQPNAQECTEFYIPRDVLTRPKVYLLHILTFLPT